MASIGEALAYPWQQGRKFWYFTVAYIPIVGIIFMSGYMLKLLQSITKGQPAPTFGDWGNNFIYGLYFLILSFASGVASSFVTLPLGFIPFLGQPLSIVINIAISLFVLIMTLQLAQNMELIEAFDIEKAWNYVVKNFTEILIAFLKSCVVFLVYGFIPLAIFGFLFFAAVFGFATYSQAHWSMFFVLFLAMLIFMAPIMYINGLASYKIYGDMYRENQ